ncbi:hypothetical protein J1781_11450 [Rahnella sp. C60]|uniref:hypothetical protein n=1 Tax=Rahnella perminowiae TaxID=2816244 RepID=UPI001C27E894|nr:hypothetical protein [Rahnella perminowiae]MBU9815466.1 hypothetical protein [Rahnella perminowiae]
MDSAKIAYLYASEISALDRLASPKEPKLNVEVQEFPTEVEIILNFGFMAFAHDTHYSLSTKIYKNDKVVNDPDIDGQVFEHSYHISENSYYVSTMRSIEKFTVTEPGYYLIEIELSSRKLSDEVGSEKKIDQHSAYICISHNWIS